MADTLHVGILGAGAIGCYVGMLLQSKNNKNELKVTFVGRKSLMVAVEKDGGMRATNGKGLDIFLRRDQITVSEDISSLSNCNIIVVCVKTVQTEAVAAELAKMLEEKKMKPILIYSFQNGIGNADIIRKHVNPKHTVLSTVVDFNTVWLSGAHFHNATLPPKLSLQTPPKEYEIENFRSRRFCRSLSKALFKVTTADDVEGFQYAKLMFNLINSINALSGLSVKGTLSEGGYRMCIYAAVQEAAEAYKSNGIVPKRSGIPLWALTTLLRMPDWLFWVVITTVVKIDPTAKSSMLQDLERGRKTEIKYLNGLVVSLAKKGNLKGAPVNQRLMDLIQMAEEKKQGSPKISASDLCRELGVSPKKGVFSNTSIILFFVGIAVLMGGTMYSGLRMLS